MESLLDHPAVQRLQLRFFDLELHLYSDARAFLDLFARMYRRFQVDASAAPAPTTMEIAVLTGPDHPWGKPVLVLDGQAWPLDETGLQGGAVYERVLYHIVGRIRDHFIIHAGVVARHGQGVILAADSSFGKTTLVLALLRRGFKLLSDEMAALGRADGLLHPFPRMLRVRPGTLELLGFPGTASQAPLWLGKALLDVEEIQPGGLAGAAAIRHIVILRDPAEKGRPPRPERELDVYVDRVDEGFLDGLRRVKGVVDLHADPERVYPLLTLRVGHGTAVLSQIEALAGPAGVSILDVVKRSGAPPAFDGPAQLEAIPTSRATIELLRRFQGGHRSALLAQEFGGSSTRMFIELASIIDQADCYQLWVGPLDEMADLVAGLVDNERRHK